MDTTDLSRTKVTPITRGENVLVTEGLSKDRQGHWQGPPPEKEPEGRGQGPPEPSGADKSGDEETSQGRIINIVI